MNKPNKNITHNKNKAVQNVHETKAIMIRI